ncbi:MFS transporter [Virgibacillus siamensis]|uniref:MFS transporter n=1 Tax=Virgibacillus siamensis TaxID=480071 RepID=UPI0009854D03|nr:MFS transporter [Virgibacillus siamensis]
MRNAPKLWTPQFLAIVVMAFLFFLCLQLLTAGFPAYITSVKNDPTQAGLMTTVFMAAAILTRPLIGYMMQKINMKVISTAALILLVVSVGLSYEQDSIAVLLSLRAIHGIGFGIVSTIFATMATTIIPVKRLGEGIGYYGMATSIGTSVAPMFALALLQFYSYNVMIIFSVILTIAALLLCFFVKAPEMIVSENETADITLKEYVFDKKALLPCILTVFFTITLGGVISFLSGLGNEAGLKSVSLFFLVMTIMMTVIRPFSGKWFDKYGHKVVIYPAAISGMIALFLLSITHHTITLLVAGVFYGISYGIVTPTLQAIAVSFVERHKQGTANAMFFSSMDLGMAIGSTGLGMLVSVTSYHFIYGFSILSIVILLFLYSIGFAKAEKEYEVVENQ